MNEYIATLKELVNYFSYYQFIDFLQKIDKEIMNKKITYLDSDFIYYLKQIINMINDRYIVDGKNGTLGHMLVENALLNKERLSPMLLVCFFLEQKANLDLDVVCNEIYFSDLSETCYRMMITDYDNNNHSSISINLRRYSDLRKNADEFNYQVMFDLLHELTHVYQLTRMEQSESTFDKLAFYDYQKDNILISNIRDSNNIFFHQALLTEFMADEQAYVFLLHLMQIHPEYFNDDLIQEKQSDYQRRKNGTYGDYGTNPREEFDSLMSYIGKTYEQYPNESSLAYIKSMLEVIEILSQKSKPLIAQLQSQGISEKAWDSYYNIYLKSLYRFDGKTIVVDSDLRNTNGIKIQ